MITDDEQDRLIDEYGSKAAAEIERLQRELEHSEVTIDNLEKTQIREAGLLEQKIEQLQADMQEIDKLIYNIASDVRGVFHERPALYYVVVQVHAIALCALEGLEIELDD